MTLQLRPAITQVIALTTAAIVTQAPPAHAGVAAASLIATETTTASPLTDCDPARHGTIISDATESIAALGTENPIAQASVLLAGLGCLTGGSLWLKRQLP